jgi:hypothetical protein
MPGSDLYSYTQHSAGTRPIFSVHNLTLHAWTSAVKARRLKGINGDIESTILRVTRINSSVGCLGALSDGCGDGRQVLHRACE